MRHIRTDVVVIGGGATGVGVVRDLALRGYDALCLDRADLAQGTSGRFHGLLHSGGRYVVSDPVSARECAQENLVVTRIHADAVETCGGLFVVTPHDDETYADGFLAAAAAAGVPATEIGVAEALRREPRLHPGLKRAFEVGDGAVDGWAMVWGAARSAREYGAQVLTHHEVVGIDVVDGAVVGVRARDHKAAEDVRVDCGFVLNCAGAWAGRIAALAGAHGVDVVPGRGVMVAMNHRLVNTVVNRCLHPGDGDILVPVHTVSIIGTTDVAAPDPDRLEIPRAEVAQMIAAGEEMIPGFSRARALHAWAGARPLVRDSRVSAADTRHMSRGMSIIDHRTRDGISGLLTISGGKLTTYRLMAEKLVDAMEAARGESRPCRTADEPVPAASSGRTYAVTHRLAAREDDRLAQQILCECELLDRGSFEALLAKQPSATFDDLRRQLRLGMGPCQGGFCSMRAAGIACARGVEDTGGLEEQPAGGLREDSSGGLGERSVSKPDPVDRSNDLLRLFLANRWLGLAPILDGAQVRQTALDAWMLSGILDVDHLPVRVGEAAEDVAAGLADVGVPTHPVSVHPPAEEPGRLHQSRAAETHGPAAEDEDD